ncbi:Ig-like domain-containing protein [Paenibacillus sp. P96]|uniref:Ig-like domain-containing protein n=1 Tax=Paenibacillus zeirhizosphaerae TaxID=2987519 RepID=A0ABT9FN00_9BACL|nr:Ig-like domain-containing protein [Paenibacillus sp. P96]MDP4096054.1 Ig-like domain-containing protein [Paenibacillus sp. P96]
MRNRWTKPLAIMLSFLLLIVGATPAWAASAVSKIVLSANSSQLMVGETLKLTATAVYSDAKTSDVTINSDWTSDDAAIASVYNGTVTAKSVGTATIVAIFKDGDGKTFSQSTSITVTKKVKALTADVTSLNLRKGTPEQVTLTATYSDNTIDNTVANEAEWTSSNSAVATVVNGSVTGIAAGTATITGMYGKQTVTIEVTVDVVKRVTASSTEVSLLLSDAPEKVTLTATFPDGTTEDVTANAEWSSSDATVADVLKGSITPYKQGTAVITAEYGTKTATITVSVEKTNKLTVDVENLFLKIGGEKQLTLTAAYPDAAAKDVTGDAGWTSSDESIASVYKGKVIGNKAGEATITAKYGDRTVTVKVSVEVARYLDFNQNQAIIDSVGGKQQLELTATFADGTRKNVTTTAAYTSSNPSVADVKDGYLIGYSAGTTTITASYGTQTATLSVKVGQVNKLSVDKSEVYLDVKGTHQPVLKDENGADVTSKATWTSSNENVAYVSSGGLITAYNPGTATITATYGGKSATITVNVETASHLDIGSSKVSMSVNGKPVQLTAKVTYTDGSTEVVTDDTTWTSDKDSVVYVNKGKLTAYNKGTAVITATYNGKSATVTVTVGEPSKLAVKAKSVVLDIDDTYQAELTVTYKDGTTENVADEAEWTTTSSAIASVDSSGLITGMSEGGATITAAYGNMKATIKVEVGLAAELEADKFLIVMSAGDAAQLITLTATDSDGNTRDVTKDAEWSSSQTTIASVKDGSVKAYKKGKATITAKYGGQKVTITVEVDTATKISASEVSLSMKTGETNNIKITATLSDGSTVDVTNKVEWTASSYKVATVKSGAVTATGYGKTTITAKYGGKSVKVPVTVDALKYLETSEVLLNLTVGQQVQLSATATYVDDTEADVTKKGVWTSSRILVATAKNGIIKGVSKGKTTVMLKYAGKTTKVVVNVTEK